MELDVGRLAAWRLASYSTFGGTWLSDYVPNRLGGFIREQKIAPERIKPDCPLIGEDGNIFRIMGIASETLRENGMQEQAKEMRSRIFQCQSYDSALSIIGDYVNRCLQHCERHIVTVCKWYEYSDILWYDPIGELN